MKGLKKFLALPGLLLLLFFAFNGGGNIAGKIQKEHSGTYFSSGRIYAMSFIQPETARVFAVNAKADNHCATKWHYGFMAAISEFKVREAFACFLDQDIDRCENVSLLIFPFHFFW